MARLWLGFPLGIRLALACLAAEIVLVGLLILGAARIMDESLASRAQVRVDDIKGLLSLTLADPMVRKDYGQLTDVLRAVGQREDIAFLVLADVSGNVLARQGSPDAQQSRHQRIESSVAIGMAGQTYGTLSFGLSLAFLEEARERMIWTLAFSGAIVAALSIAVFLGIGYLLSRPIKALTRRAEALAQGDMEVSIPHAEGVDEVGRLSSAFARMAEALKCRIAELQDNQGRLNRSVDELMRSNSELERFAFVASHDLREPIRSIVSFAQLLERKLKAGTDDPEVLEFLGYLVASATRMNDMVNDLLVYSRIDGTEEPFEAVALGDVLGQALDNLSSTIAATGAEIVTRGELPLVSGSTFQLAELFQNLIGNSIKFARPGLRPHVVVSATREDGFWHLSLADNGIGIDAEFREKAFEIFRRFHPPEIYPGSGMGLAICKKIVERHGGRIWFDSEPGIGTVFHFTLAAR